MAIKSICLQNNSPVVCDSYVKYEEAEVDRLVAILKTNNCGSGGGPCEIPVGGDLKKSDVFFQVCFNSHTFKHCCWTEGNFYPFSMFSIYVELSYEVIRHESAKNKSYN